jgi:outer membrane protein OmpA-like peptidoglycan-associated protein
MRNSNRLFPLALAGLLAAPGCSTPNKQLTSCQGEKEQLLTTIKSQRDETRTLHEQVASLESRLDQSEKLLAHGGSNTRISSRPSPSTSPASPAVKADSLPWRSPAQKSESNTNGQEPKFSPPAKTTNQRSSSSTDGQRSSSEDRSTGTGNSRAALMALVRRDERVKYDSSAGAARVDAPLEFNSQSATLTATDKRRLDEVARLLRSEEARNLKIVVAGCEQPLATKAADDESQARAISPQLASARAKAVADYLDRHGIPEERLAVSSAAGRSTTAGDVQIFLLDPESTSFAWNPAKSTRR